MSARFGLWVVHWISALLLIPMLLGGYFWLRPMASSDPQKLDALMYHMAVGVALVALTVLRLVLRRRSGFRRRGLVGWSQTAVYPLVLLMPVSGFTMVFAARLNDIVFARNGAPLPADLAAIPGHVWHGATAATLAAAIVLHLVTITWERIR